MKFIYYYHFTEKEYEAESDEELAKMLHMSVESLTGACEFAKNNNGFAVVRTDPNTAVLENREVLLFTKSREEMEELIAKKYNEVLSLTT